MAERARAAELLAVVRGPEHDEERGKTVHDVIATTWAELVDPDQVKKPLRRIGLRQLMLSDPHVKPRHVERTLALFLARLPTIDRPDVHRIDLGWLLDCRTGGARYLAWLEAHSGRTTWPGFPLTPRPVESEPATPTVLVPRGGAFGSLT